MAASVSDLVQTLNQSGAGALFERGRGKPQQSRGFSDYNDVPEGTFLLRFNGMRCNIAEINGSKQVIFNFPSVIEVDPARGEKSMYVGKQGDAAVFTGPPKNGTHADSINSGLVFTLQTLGVPTEDDQYSGDGLFQNVPKFLADTRPLVECNFAKSKDGTKTYVNLTRRIDESAVDVSASNGAASPPPATVASEEEEYDPEEGATVPFEETAPAEEEEPWSPKEGEYYMYKPGSTENNNPLTEEERASKQFRVKILSDPDEKGKVGIQKLDVTGKPDGRPVKINVTSLQ